MDKEHEMSILLDALETVVKDTNRDFTTCYVEIEQQTKSICQLLNEIPKENRHRYIKRIEYLIARFSQIVNDLQEKKTQLSQKMHQLNQQEKAKNAYQHVMFFSEEENGK